MRRRLALLVVLACAGEAGAKIVIMEPPVVHACPGGKTWADVEKCLTPIGALETQRTLPNARLVKVGDQGSYLYVQTKAGWHIGGMYEGSHYWITSLAPITIGKHAGFRIDIVEQIRSTAAIDGVNSVPAILTTHRTLFCPGDRYSCADATSRCDVMVKGKTVWTFQGKLEIIPNEVHVLGDGRIGGPVCQPEGKVFLGWTDDDG